MRRSETKGRMVSRLKTVLKRVEHTRVGKKVFWFWFWFWERKEGVNSTQVLLVFCFFVIQVLIFHFKTFKFSFSKY